MSEFIVKTSQAHIIQLQSSLLEKMTLRNPVNIYISTEIHRFLFMKTKSVSLKTERTCWQCEITEIKWLLQFRRIPIKAV